MKSNKAVYRKLQVMKNDYSRSNLERAVIEDLLDNDEAYIIGSMTDVLNHGCVSGCVGSLIYYHDTYKFFDEYYEDIMDLVEELNNQGLEVDLMKDGNMKNTGAWLAYEETVRKLCDELQIEY